MGGRCRKTKRQLRGQRSPSGDARAKQNEERQNQPHRSAQNITRHRGNRCRETERRPSTHRRREGSKGRRHEARHLTRDEDERANEDEERQPDARAREKTERHAATAKYRICPQATREPARLVRKTSNAAKRATDVGRRRGNCEGKEARAVTRAHNRMKSVKRSRIGRRKTSHDIEETDVERPSGVPARIDGARDPRAKPAT